MGDQRRTDSDRDQHKAPARAPEPAPGDVDHEEAAAFDPAHAGKQQAMHKDWGLANDSRPEAMVEGVGDQDKLWARYQDAFAAGRGADLPKLVLDMDRDHREKLRG